MAYCCTHTLFVDHPSSFGPVAVAHVAHVSVQLTYQAIQYRRRSPTTSNKEWRRAQITAWDENKMNYRLIDGIIIDSDTANLKWMDAQISRAVAQPTSSTNVRCRQQKRIASFGLPFLPRILLHRPSTLYGSIICRAHLSSHDLLTIQISSNMEQTTVFGDS